jgi:hypothetical protein
VSIKGVQVETDTIPPQRYLYAHPQINSGERNQITGGVADVLIALNGEDGTVQEISWAFFYKKPIVFLNSYVALELWARNMNNLPCNFPAMANVSLVTSEEKAVDTAIKLATINGLTGTFPSTNSIKAAVTPAHRQQIAKLEGDFNKILISL